MNKERIEEIALEVAKELVADECSCATDEVDDDMDAEDKRVMVEYAHRLLARIDAERGKGAIGGEMNKEHTAVAQELWSAAQLVPGEGIEDGAGRIASILSRIDAERGKDAAVHQYQDREGNWKPFIDARHYENTVKDGTWPIRALYTTTQPAVPEGYALVPVEPTKEMIDQMTDERFVELASGKGYTFADMYQAMLAAVKEPK